MARKFILTVATIAALSSTALVTVPAFAGRGGGFGGGHGGFHGGGGGHASFHGGGHTNFHSGSSHKSGNIGVSHNAGKTATGLGTHGSGKAWTGTGKIGAGSNKFGSGSGKLSTGPRKLGNGPGKLASGPGNKGTAPNGTANIKTASLTGGQGAGANNSATNKTASTTGSLKAGPDAGKTYRDLPGPTNNPTPTNQNAQNPNPPQNNGGVQPPQGGWPGIKTTWNNNFNSSLKGSWDPGSIGTGYSVCVLMGMCAAGAPPGVIDIMMAPLSGNQSSAFQGVVDGFKPTDPNNPLSDPIDTGIKNFNLNPFNTTVYPKTGPAAVGQ
jgi:hypothetical protein